MDLDISPALPWMVGPDYAIRHLVWKVHGSSEELHKDADGGSPNDAL